MADRVLLQVWVDVATAERVDAIKKVYRLDTADFLRSAIAKEAARLESHPAPFDASDPSCTP